VRSLSESYPFEHWPIHKVEEFEQYRKEIEEIRKIKSNLDI